MSFVHNFSLVFGSLAVFLTGVAGIVQFVLGPKFGFSHFWLVTLVLALVLFGIAAATRRSGAAEDAATA